MEKACELWILCSYCVPVSRKHHVYGSFHLDIHSVIRDLLHGIPARLLFHFFMVFVFQSEKKISKRRFKFAIHKADCIQELLRQRCLNCRYSHNSSPSYQDLFPEYVLLQRVWLGCDGVLSNLNPVENLLIQSKFFLVPNYYPFRFSRQHVWVPEMKRNFSSIHICRWLERQKRHSF